ncbi:lecithin:cholesterol acyltransferase [Faecalibacterium sp. CAG:1138]|nr:lecithin:cholesterol acyltransferase [Faecalibacterium sp. CAG:1138]
MKKSVKIVAILTVLVMGVLTVLSACDGNKPKPEKKAIIMVTALMSGGLYDKATGENLWDPLPEEYEMISVLEDGIESFVLKLVAAKDENGQPLLKNLVDRYVQPILEKKEDKSNLIWSLAQDQYGVGNNPDVTPANGVDSKISHGVLAAYKPMMEDLDADYFKDYTVATFNYDWRIDNRENSRLLEEYINENGFTNVVFMSHSMGGMVVSGYLARSEENRKKVDAYLSYAGAFMGSLDALTYLNDPWSFLRGMGIDKEQIGEMLSNPAISGVLSSVGLNVDEKVVEDLMDNVATPFLQNMTSVIQLLPTWEYLSSEQYGEGEGICIDGELIKSKDELYEYYCTRDWAFLRDENGNKISDGKGGFKLKPAVESLREFHDGLYVRLDSGEKVFASHTVNAYYFVGNNLQTRVTYNDITGGIDEYGKKPAGDGVVPYYSAIPGYTTAEIEAMKQNGHVIEYSEGHFEVGCKWSMTQEDVYKILEAETAK